MADSVLILSQFFHPEITSSQQLLTELAVELRRKGLSVTVFTAQPTYHSASRLSSRDQHEGVTILRLPSTQLSRRSSFGRLANAVSFSISCTIRLLFSRNGGPIVATTVPPFLPWVTWVVRVLRRRKYVVLVHDVYPNVAVKLGYVKEGGIIAAVWGALNRIAYRQASAVIVLGSGMQHEVEKEIGERGPPVHIIHNWADGELLVPRSKGDNWFAARYKMQEKLVLLYSGNIGLAHDMETIIEATACLREYSSQLRVLFIGEGAKKAKLMSLVEQRGLTNVHFLPPVPYEQLPYSIAAGDIGLVTLEKGLEGLCEPSKVYGYLAVGLAILGLTGERSEVAEIIQRHECGYRVDQGDVEGVVKALIRWLDNPAELQQMKTNARRCFQKYYEKRHAIAKYLEVLEDV